MPWKFLGDTNDLLVTFSQFTITVPWIISSEVLTNNALEGSAIQAKAGDRGKKVVPPIPYASSLSPKTNFAVFGQQPYCLIVSGTYAEDQNSPHSMLMPAVRLIHDYVELKYLSQRGNDEISRKRRLHEALPVKTKEMGFGSTAATNA
ncbi:hypothetical protein Cantr_04469 [Candida viswanathii]|uniref:Uncharacterized protein n=1 Tax=Candida viswanathii TaxID=5486 RepID=A0A367XMS7_9ASCO|nr:hypothetical protein Cantr_04469 [Candida viswanathii]